MKTTPPSVTSRSARICRVSSGGSAGFGVTGRALGASLLEGVYRYPSTWNGLLGFASLYES